MRNFLSGFLFGVLATSAVFLLKPVREDARPAAPAQRPAGTRSVDPDAPATTSAAGDAARETAVADLAEGQIATVSAEAPAIDVAGAPLPAVPSPEPATASAPRPSSFDAIPSRDYPPEIAEMIQSRVDPALQNRYETDAREESWATYMEGQLQAYFASKPALQQFNFSLIDCRTSVCSVHALGYGPDALTQWNLATADIVTQPWHDFKSMSMNRQNPQPDVLGIVLILTRDPN